MIGSKLLEVSNKGRSNRADEKFGMPQCIHSQEMFGSARLIESMMVLRPRQGNLRQVFRLFKSHARLSAEHET